MQHEDPYTPAFMATHMTDMRPQQPQATCHVTGVHVTGVHVHHYHKGPHGCVGGPPPACSTPVNRARVGGMPPLAAGHGR
mmetsp:Transcript_10186/g.21790  ORF Transcript_10186/g.21790 Transcript_10186/m.21790 type:complete len:80 (-) Transcript_10186:46-285(-)